MDDEKARKRLCLIDRRICYAVCFFIFQVVAINSFDSDILSIVTFYLSLPVVVLFNLVRPRKNAVMLGAYILPFFVSAFSFLVGDHKLGFHVKP